MTWQSQIAQLTITSNNPTVIKYPVKWLIRLLNGALSL